MQALQSSGTLQSLGSLRALQSLRTLQSSRALEALIAFDSLNALHTLGSGRHSFVYSDAQKFQRLQQMTDEQGPTGMPYPSEDTGPTGTISVSELTGGSPPQPLILLSDLLTHVSVLQRQEAEDRTSFDVFLNPDLPAFRAKLIGWIAGGYQGACDLFRVVVSPPNICSDGVSRNLFDYIEFVSGKSLVDHMKTIQAILPEFEVGYRCSRSELTVCVVTIKS